MTAQTPSGRNVGSGSLAFGPGYESKELMHAIADPKVYMRSINSHATDRMIADSQNSQRNIREWAALNLVCWLNTRNSQPGLAIERTESRPALDILYDVEMGVGLNDTITSFRIVVEELAPESFRLTIMRLRDNNAPEIVWSKIGRN